MPRVRATANTTAANTASPMKSAQIPLNDDRQEKAQRLQSRQAAHAKQLDSYKAAASPAKKRKSLGQSQDGPSTPSQSQGETQDYGVAGTAITPMNMRKGANVPILANFEEWMKMATDNKINTNNTWNFALIDYFHDMSLLKEGDGVNFQKASCTLDGCVKIYTSRVDSVASETGKLLSGLVETKGKKGRGGDESTEGDDAEDGEDESVEEGGAKKKKRAKRSAEATLVNSFEQLRLKKMELEFAVDPLFKKASADFDEGGAKGLLLNHLSIDATGRIVFDSSDDAQEDATDASRRDSMDPEGEEGDKQHDTIPEDKPIDISRLASRFFPNLSNLENQDICPSLKTFELGSGDASMDLPFLKAPENWRDERPDTFTGGADQTAMLQDDLPNFGADDNDDAGGVFDMPADIGFGEGGEAWARGAAIHTTYNNSAADGDDEGGEVGTFDANGNAYGVKLHHRPENDQENILNYFDAALQKNWAGPEHWKIARIREAASTRAATAEKKKERKEKEAFEIDFLAPMTQGLADQLYTSADGGGGGGKGGRATIDLPKKDWKARNRNLLPDDKHFSSRDLLRLFLKPKAMIGARRSTARQQIQRRNSQGFEGEVDEAYWASNNHSAAAQQAGEGAAVQGDYDANFFNDDNLPIAGGDMLDDDEFADAREEFSPGADEVDAAGSGPEGPGIDGIMAGAGSQGAAGEAFGANLIAQSRRLRPEYVQYARVAKKVDVRRLKEEMWKGIGFEQPQSVPPTPSAQLQPPPTPSAKNDLSAALHFVDIMNNLQHVYPKQQMADISTSYGFICLLHLANEKGLVIENVEGWEDLVVRRDFGAVITEVDA